MTKLCPTLACQKSLPVALAPRSKQCYFSSRSKIDLAGKPLIKGLSQKARKSEVHFGLWWKGNSLPPWILRVILIHTWAWGEVGDQGCLSKNWPISGDILASCWKYVPISKVHLCCIHAYPFRFLMVTAYQGIELMNLLECSSSATQCQLIEQSREFVCCPMILTIGWPFH